MSYKEVKDKEVKAILENHFLWLENKKQGKQADFSACDLSGVNFSELFPGKGEIDLSGVSFSYSSLNDTCFEHCNLSKANFTGASGRHTDFSGIITAEGISFFEAAFQNSQFHDINLQDSHLQHGSFQSCDFSRTSLKNALARVAEFNHSIFENAVLEDIDGYGSNFADCDLSYVCFSNANLTYAKLTDTQLDHTDFTWATLQNANLSHASGHWTDFQKADLTSANCSYGQFESARLSEGKFHAVTGNHLMLLDSDCRDADFSGSSLLYAMFRQTTLRQADFSQAKLHGCTMEFCKTAGTVFPNDRIIDHSTSQSQKMEKIGEQEELDLER